MNSPRLSSTVTLAGIAAALVTTLAACGSDTETSSASTSPTSTAVADPFSVTETQMPAAPPTPAAGSACPTAAPAAGGTPEWTLNGATGNVAVTGSTDTTAPDVKVGTPFSVTETQVHTLQAGDGPVVSPTATVSVCYMGVNGRDGSVFDSSYERGAPEEFPLTGVVAGFQKAIAGQKVGSTVAVAMTSADGYADGQPAAGILPGDTLVFAIKILDAAG
ncbi:MAG: FKBP-type peptidyl-prolyl cis-trans isomerase [Mycobacterium sp.]